MPRLNFGNTNKRTVLQSINNIYYLASTCFGIYSNFRELTPKFHQRMQHKRVHYKGTVAVLIRVRIFGQTFSHKT
jgi:hypothetical protein